VSLIRQTAWASAAAIALALSRFAIVAIVARRSPAETFGQFAYGQWIVDLAFLVCSLGATGFIGRYLAEYRHDSKVVAAIVRRWRPFAIALPWAAGAAALIGAGVSGLALSPFGMGMLAFWTIANGAWAMQTAALNGMQRFDLIFFANMFAGCVMIAGALLVPVAEGDASALFALMAVCALIGTAIGLNQTFRLAAVAAGPIDGFRWRSASVYAFNVWITAILWNLVWSRGELPIVRTHLGDAGVARYAAALTLFGGAVQAVMMIASGAAPHLTRLWGEGSRTAATSMALALMDVQILAAGAAALALIGLGPELMHLAFGVAYRQDAQVLSVLGIGLLAMAVSGQSHLLQLVTDARFTRNVALLGLVVLLVAAVVLVTTLGITGAAVARAGAMLSMAGATLLATQARWGRTAFSGRNFLIALVAVAISTGVATWLGEERPVWRAITSTVALVALCAMIRNTGGRAVLTTVLARIWRERATGANAPGGTRRS